MEKLLREIEFIGILLLDENGEILYSNSIAKRYNFYFPNIIDAALNDISIYSLSSYPAEIISIRKNNKIIVQIHPINELVRYKKETEVLESVRNELNRVIDSSFDGIVICDKDGIIIHQNPSYEKITGLSAKDCIGRSLKELEEENVIDVSASLKALSENREVTINQKIATGSTVLVSAVPIRNKYDEIEKIVNNVRDLTHLNALETEVHQLEKQNKKIHQELELLKEQNNPKLSIIAQSEIMKDLLDRALRVAHIDSGVLIQGASGVGKEKIVDLIHRNSLRKDLPLIKINCGAIPESLLESELFGYESGSFTGASQKGKAGLFEAANSGTIFLDEIGEMPIHLQVKLLRVLQEQEITRIGGTKAISVDTRIIAATNRNLQDLIETNLFREDLYYRLNIIPINIPSLKDRKDDIIPLIYHFLNGINFKYGIKRNFTIETLNTFINYDWPGNVRELQNLVERIALMSNNAEITVTDLQKELGFNNSQQLNLIVKQSSSSNNLNSSEIEPLKVRIDSFEAQIIEETIRNYSSVRKAAVALKIDQSTLVRKMQKYNIHK